MQESKRTARVEREIRELVANFLSRRLRKEIDGLVTVSRTWVSKDLRVGRVYFTVIGGSAKPEAVVEVIERHLPEIQRELAHNMTTKYCPKLEIFYDETLEKSLQIQGLIKSLEIERVANLDPKPTDASNSDDESGDTQ